MYACMQITELEEDIADMRAIFHEQLEEAVSQLQAVKEKMNSTSTSSSMTPTEQSQAFNA
jgi:hypothetical protein